MPKEYIKPELNENPKIKVALKQYADKIQEVITYDDFRNLVKYVMIKNLQTEFRGNIEKGSYIYERRLKKLFDDNRLYDKSLNKEERSGKIIEILCKLKNGKPE